MSRLKMKRYNNLSSEIHGLYHEAAMHMGISDSVQNILYVLCDEKGSCLQSDIYKLCGISRQTINSAIRKLETAGIVCLEQGQGRNTIVRLTEKGKVFAEEKAYPLLQIEDNIFNEWTTDEQQEYLRLTEKFRDTLKREIAKLL